jgi:hypothetical protein
MLINMFQYVQSAARNEINSAILDQKDSPFNFRPEAVYRTSPAMSSPGSSSMYCTGESVISSP